MYFLTGLPAIGKSYWGALWAQKAKLPFVDLDAAIEKSAGRTIKAIFEQEGEAFFRALETNVLWQIIASSQQQTIVATGGGTPAFGKNLELMKEGGIVVYFKLPLAPLSKRILDQKDRRPLFRNCRSEEEVKIILAELLAGRKSFYEAAHLILPAETLSSTTFEETIQCFTVRPCS